MKKLSKRLIKASRKGKINEVKDLIKSGVDVNFIDKNGWTALIYAARNGYLKVMQYLVKHGAEL